MIRRDFLPGLSSVFPEVSVQLFVVSVPFSGIREHDRVTDKNTGQQLLLSKTSLSDVRVKLVRGEGGKERGRIC